MEATHAHGTADRTWCGTPIPPELPTRSHPTKLRVVLPLDRVSRRVRVVWCVLMALMSIPIGVAMPALGVLVLALVAYHWTRPARVTITFRPASRWVTIASPVNWFARTAYSVGVGVHRDSGGWHAYLGYGSFTLAETGPAPDRDGAVARLLPFANTLRREMGDSPLPPP